MDETSPPLNTGNSKNADPAGAADVQPDSTPDVEAILGLNRGDRRVVTVLIVVSLLLMCVQWYRLTQHRPAPLEIIHPADYHFTLDVNDATWVEWMQLDGIGEILARRIVEDRQQRGRFFSVEDVQRVKGIGPKTMAKLHPHLTCAEPGQDSQVAQTEAKE